MADIHSPTAEIRRGKKKKKKKDRKKKPRDENIMSRRIALGGHKETTGQKYNARICHAGRP